MFSSIRLSAAQQQQIKDLIAEGEADITKFDQEIARAQAVVDNIIAKRQARLNQINTYHGALCPALKLSYELVWEILLVACGEGKTSITLSHICRTWREISLASPRLWTDVRVSGRRNVQQQYVYSEDVLATQFVFPTICHHCL